MLKITKPKPTIFYLTDDNVRLYGEDDTPLCILKGSFAETFPIFKTYLSPKTQICLIIDMHQQDIHEERLPPLLPWDYLRLFFYKKASFLSQGGYAGISFFRENKSFYLRWIHVPPAHLLYEWILWADSFSGKIIFPSLEGLTFLKKDSLPTSLYRMLVYPLTQNHRRLLIFKGNRLLLSRLYENEEERKRSLHFLSRTFPDIEEKIECTSSELISFLHFLRDKKSPILTLRPLRPSHFVFAKIATCSLSMIFLLGGIGEVYYGLSFKRKREDLLLKITPIQFLCRRPKTKIPKTNTPSLRSALEKYKLIEGTLKNPLKEFKILARIFKNKSLFLQKISWKQHSSTEITLTLLMEEISLPNLISDFESLLHTLHLSFPGACISVLSAPYKSGSHEIFTPKEDHQPPSALIKIVAL